MRKKQFYFIIACLVLLAITLPYLYAAQAGGAAYVFGGFLMNLQDGNSYRAKIYQGWRGDWRFTLPYTADPGEGGYLFLFYLGLGHLARLLNAPLLLVFHGARLLGAVCALGALFRFYKALFSSPQRRKLAFAIAALGAGLGWLAIPFGAFTADFWVSETYPFLSAYANPHFPLGIALIVWLLTPNVEKHPFWRFAASFLLALLSPFGVVIVVLVRGSDLLLRGWLAQDRFASGAKPLGVWDLLAIGLGGGPVLLYQFWLSHTDPVLSGWNAQNLTLTPPLWDVILALSPALLFALLGVRRAWKEERLRLLLLWSGLGLALIFVPWSLQRRFMMGLYIPLAGLAAVGLEQASKKIKRNYRTLVVVFFLFALPTNLMVIFSGVYAARSQDSSIYLTREENQTLDWLEANTPPDALILAGPETGLYLPAHTGRRVIYGHPYETVNAESAKAAVTAFFTDEMTSAAAGKFLKTQGVDYIFYGPRERVLGEMPKLSTIESVFTLDTVTLYKVRP